MLKMANKALLLFR